MSKIDLHFHSLYSADGQFSVKDLFDQAKEKGLELIALADHNSVSGVKEAISLAPEYSFTYIPGVELDCHYQQTYFHLLAYNIDPYNEEFTKIETRVKEMNKKNQYLQIELLRKMGIVIDEEKLRKIYGNKILVAEDIAEVAIPDPANDRNEIIARYRKGGDRSDTPAINFYWDLCSGDKPANVPVTFPEVNEYLNLIHVQNGKAVIAHPGANFLDHPEMVEAILDLGADGLEAYSSYHTKAQCEFWAKLAKDHHKQVTIGSDYHGRTKPHISLGGVDCPNEKELFEQLKVFFNLPL